MQISLAAEDRIFVLTGAGISAESGLATFRGADGLWEGHRVEDVATPEAWACDPELVWRFYSLRRKAAATAEPNPAHRALAALEAELGERFFLCTQNVDDLHERAGSRRLVHMHGELFRSRCERCTSQPFADRRLYETRAEHPRCLCGGRIRPDIVWFGEVPFHMERIMDGLQRCTVMLVVGTSGVVQPAASFVRWAQEGRSVRGGQRSVTPGARAAAMSGNAALPAAGAMVRTYYVGPEHPANAASFTHVFEGRAGELLPRLFSL